MSTTVGASLRATGRGARRTERTTARAGRGRLLVLGLLPLACAGALAAAPLAAAAPGPHAGVVEARAVYLPAPSAAQMAMPMDAGMQHSDELQVVLSLRNDADSEQTVPFDRIALVGDDGTRTAATGGLVGDLVLRPHAGAEERLHFPAPTGDTVRLAVPDSAGHEQLLQLTVDGAPAGGPSAAHHH